MTRKPYPKTRKSRGTQPRRHANGYVRVWLRGHPLAAKDGYVLEHRLVLYEAGVEIPENHHVHHINGRKDDNRLENLAVIAPSDHAHHHIQTTGSITNQFGTWPLREKPGPCEWCGDVISGWGTRFCSKSCASQADGVRRRGPDHGTHTAYGRGCRCDECRAAESAYGRAYRARHAQTGRMT